MPNDSKTYILDDQWIDKGVLDFTPYVEIVTDRYKSGSARQLVPQ